MNSFSSVSPPRNFSASLSKSSNSRSRIGMMCPGTFSYDLGVLEGASAPGGAVAYGVHLLVPDRTERALYETRAGFQVFSSPVLRAARARPTRASRAGTRGSACPRPARATGAVLAHELLERGDDRGRLLRRGARRDELELRAAVRHGRQRLAVRRAMPELSVLDRDAVLAAVSPDAAIAATRDAFVRHRRGEWVMPSKVYLESPPHGDFRAMPARGGGLAILKWISSFPANPARGLPTVIGAARRLRRRDLRAAGAARRRRGDRAAHRRGGGGRRRRAGRAAASRRHHRLRPARRVGRALPGGGRLRPGVCFDPRPEAAEALAAELGWRAGTREEALAQDVVSCVTPGARAGGHRGATSHPGLHLNMLGADGPGKAEATIDAVAACALFCDEWAQASHGGELTGAVEAGRVTRERRHRPRRGARRRGAGPARPEAVDAVRLDRAGDPGPGDRRRRAGGAARRRGSRPRRCGSSEPPGLTSSSGGASPDARVVRRPQAADLRSRVASRRSPDFSDLQLRARDDVVDPRLERLGRLRQVLGEAAGQAPLERVHEPGVDRGARTRSGRARRPGRRTAAPGRVRIEVADEDQLALLRRERPGEQLLHLRLGDRRRRTPRGAS